MAAPFFVASLPRMTALFDEHGRATRWPRKARDREAVLDALAERFAPGAVVAEAEVNAILREAHTFGDWALLRRELFETGRLDRDPRAGTYWRPAPVTASARGEG